MILQHQTRPAAFAARVRQAGLSLVELMVAMTISLLILGALVALFTNTSRSNREFARANSMIESGRLAIQVLEADILHAGYWGTYVAGFDDQTAGGVPVDAPTALPDPCFAYDPAAWDGSRLRQQPDRGADAGLRRRDRLRRRDHQPPGRN